MGDFLIRHEFFEDPSDRTFAECGGMITSKKYGDLPFAISGVIEAQLEDKLCDWV